MNTKPDAATPPVGSSEAEPLSSRRLWLFRLLATALPLALVVLLELGARGLGLGVPTGFFVRPTATDDAPAPADTWVTNRRFGWRFFPPPLARAPVPTVVAPKPDGTLRIVVLGGSAAQGVPEPAFSLARHIEAMLTLRHPDTRFEVINAAMTAINSHVVLPIARDVLRHEPDALVVYLGNNEVVGPFGAGTVFGGFSPRRSWIRGLLWLRKSHLVQALTRPPDDGGARRWQGMEMFLEQRVAADDPRLDGVLGHLDANLRDLVAAARRGGTEVLLSTVASNLRDLPPFAEPEATEAGAAEIEALQAEVLAAAVEPSPVAPAPETPDPLLARCDALLAKYPESPGAHFAKGRRLLSLGRVDEATAMLTRARDFDALRFRADSRVNATIRRVAEGLGVSWVDTEAWFLDGVGDLGPLPGHRAFFEHVHFTFEGNHALAGLLLPALEEALGLTSPSAGDGIPSVDEVADVLAYTPLDALQLERDMLALVENPPFAGRPGQEDDLRRRRRQIATGESTDIATRWDAAREAWQRRVAMHPGDLVGQRRWAELLGEHGEPAAAADVWRIMTQRLPGVPAWHDALASALAESGELTEALAELDRAATLAPETAGEVAINRGQILAQAGEVAAAEAAFQEAEALRPHDPLPRYNRIRLAVDQGGDTPASLESAVGRYRDLLRDHPDFAEGHHNLGVVLTRLGRFDEARSSLERAVAAAPSMASAHNSLGLAREQLGQLQAAEAAYRTAIEINPRYTLALFNLADLLLTERRVGEAIDFYRQGLALDPGNIAARRNMLQAESIQIHMPIQPR